MDYGYHQILLVHSPLGTPWRQRRRPRLYMSRMTCCSLLLLLLVSHLAHARRFVSSARQCLRPLLCQEDVKGKPTLEEANKLLRIIGANVTGTFKNKRNMQGLQKIKKNVRLVMNRCISAKQEINHFSSLFSQCNFIQVMICTVVDSLIFNCCIYVKLS